MKGVEGTAARAMLCNVVIDECEQNASEQRKYESPSDETSLLTPTTDRRKLEGNLRILMMNK